MKTALVTVIIPCYNAELFLKDSISSIANQTYRNLEIIIIDDGSTDNSVNICKKFEQEDSRIILINNEKNIGLINTLNRGIDLAKGEFIARMDADDISNHIRIEEQIKYLKENPTIAILGCNSNEITKNGEDSHKRIRDIYLEPTTLKFSSLFTQPLVHGSIIGKSEILKANKYALEFKYAEDFELWLRILSKGYLIANTPLILYSYRINPNGVSQQNDLSQIKTHNKVSKIYLEKFLNHSIEDKYIGLINNRPINKFNISDVKHSLNLFNLSLTKSTNNITSELNKYKILQTLDICFQAIKYSSSKWLKIKILILTLPSLFKALFIKSFISKVILKIKS